MLEQLLNEYYKLEKQQSESYSHEVTEQMNLIESQINILMNTNHQKELDFYQDLLTSTNLELKMTEKDLEYLRRKHKLYSSKITLLLNSMDNAKS